MKKTILFLSAMMSIILSKAQSIVSVGSNDKFIEIKVSDTLIVPAETMTLMVSLSTDDEESFEIADEYDDDYKKDDKQKKKEEDNMMEKKNKIEAVFAKYKIANFKFHTKDKSKDPFSKDFSIYEDAYVVKIDNVSIYTQLSDELKAFEDVTVSITEVNVKDKHAYELQLVEKLMNKAKKEALAIAKYMGTTLGNPLNVSNQSWDDMYTSMFSKPESMGGLGALFGMIGNMFNASKQSTTVTISKTLVVRFAIGN